MKKYLTPAQLSARYLNHIAETTLRNWRCYKRGPTPTTIAGHVYYELSEIKRWEKTQIAGGNLEGFYKQQGPKAPTGSRLGSKKPKQKA